MNLLLSTKARSLKHGATTTRRHVLLALILVAASPTLAAAQSSGSDRIAIVDATRRKVAATELMRDLGRPFEPKGPCEPRSSGATVRDVLGGTARAILVYRYDRQGWRNMTVVGDYIRRVLDAPPEGGLQPGVYWAEGRRAEIAGAIEFSTGPPSRIEFANGYVHVEDSAGCQWWGRYLGGDRRAWVVRN